jgi:hypothetical protein
VASARAAAAARSSSPTGGPKTPGSTRTPSVSPAGSPATPTTTSNRPSRGTSSRRCSASRARKVVQQCLKNGWSDELIASALREAPVVSGAAFDLWRNNREARGTDEPWITELLALSAPFFDGRDLLAWRHANVEALRATIRTLGHWGFDRGETMIRIAVAARHPQDMTNPTKLAKLPRIDRFKGLPDDLSDAMERAYRNLGWRAS